MRKPIRRENRTPAGHRPTKITFGEMREMGVRGILVYCADYRCSHLVTLSADRWPDDLRLSDVEPRVHLQGVWQARVEVRRISIGTGGSWRRLVCEIRDITLEVQRGQNHDFD